MKSSLLLLLVILITPLLFSAQNDSVPTKGLIYHSDLAAKEYTLLAPQSYDNVYLIDLFDDS